MFETLGHYKILERIGAGGMGEVYRARDTHHGRTVAVQVIVADVAKDPDQRARLVEDARIAAALSHPNIAVLYESGEDQDQLFLVYEYVPGKTLRSTIGGAPLNPRRAVDLAVQIADALADAHGADVVHLNLSPDTIMVTPKGNAKVLDFGLAAWARLGAERQKSVPSTGRPATTAETAAYISTEQAQGAAVDHRFDIFSLGVVMFEMLAGKLPPATAAGDAMGPAPSAVNRALPVELDAIVSRALAKNPDRRYESSATLAAELRSVAALLDTRSETQNASPPPVLAKGRRSSGGRWMWLLLLFAALAALAWYGRGLIG
jgi:serine/threonine-protein kinase